MANEKVNEGGGQTAPPTPPLGTDGGNGASCSARGAETASVPSPERKKCKATTRRGWPCPAFVNEGLEYCYGHAAHRIRELEDAILYALSEEGGFACPLSTVNRLLAALRERTPFKAEEY